MTNLAVDDVLRSINDADVIVADGFITNACRIGNAWHLTVRDLDSGEIVKDLVVPIGGLVEIIRIDR